MRFKVDIHYFVYRYSLLIGLALLISGIIVTIFGTKSLIENFQLGFIMGFIGMLLTIFSCIYAIHFVSEEESADLRPKTKEGSK